MARWLIAYGAFGVPQAAAPIAFGLLAVQLFGTADAGAGLVLAMTAAQVVCAVPATRFGRRFHPTHYLRALFAIRAIALASVALLAGVAAPLWTLIAAAAVAGAFNGAAYGYLRSVLTHLVSRASMTRALGVAATVNEVTFVLTPVAIAAVGSVSPSVAVLVAAALGALPLFLLPKNGSPELSAARSPQRRMLDVKVLLWLVCELALGSLVAGVEVGAVSLSLKFRLEPGWAALFPLALCAASVGGGIWISIRNRRATNGTVVAMMLVAATGGVLVMSDVLSLALVGAAVIGACLAPLITHFAIVVEEVTPSARQPEAFALLRTADSLGVIMASGITAVLGPAPALLCSALLAVGLGIAVGVVSVLQHRR